MIRETLDFCSIILSHSHAIGDLLKPAGEYFFHCGTSWSAELPLHAPRSRFWLRIVAGIHLPGCGQSHGHTKLEANLAGATSHWLALASSDSAGTLHMRHGCGCQLCGTGCHGFQRLAAFTDSCWLTSLTVTIATLLLMNDTSVSLLPSFLA